MKVYLKEKVPHFFKYAKDCEDEQISDINNSIVNRFEKDFKSVKLNTLQADLGELDYKLLMHDQNIKIDQKVIDVYSEYSSTW